MTSDPDADLDGMDHVDLLARAKQMRQAIREHRNSTGHDLCWHHPDLWALLPESPSGGMTVPEWPQFMRGCVRYRASLDEQLGKVPRTTKEFGE